MGCSVFQKLLRSQSQSTASARIIIPLLNKPILSHPPPLPSSTPAATRSTSPLLTPPSQSQKTVFQSPSLAEPRSQDRISKYCPSSQQFFPSFSLGFFLNPNSSTGLIETDVESSDSSDLRTIWCDSVKKKRKRKMNQHKLRKLRKRLRRKT